MDHFELQLEGHETLVKFAAFIVVQALVYLILSDFSGVFSGAGGSRSASFRRLLERSDSARLMAALLAEMPRLIGGGEPSSPAGSQLLLREGPSSNDGRGDMDAVELELILIRCSFSS
uniref:Uncharacterized protein n=1 Tax=Leersia perrieri TaxID=77586 RepID=A0A0D9V0A7_9ORYZ